MKKKKNNKIIFIVIAIIVLTIGGLFYFLNVGDIISGTNKNAIGVTDITKKSYGYPLVRLLSYNQGIISVDAGIYRYGDVDQNGKVDNDDASALEVMIETETVGFTEGQIKLADIDEDGTISENDLTELKQYLETNGEVEYSISSNLLQYCITSQDNSNNCSWQSSSEFKIDKNKDYYVFVKQKNNGRISDSMFFDKSTTDEGTM